MNIFRITERAITTINPYRFITIHAHISNQIILPTFLIVN